ncbi:hypothetical protein BDSB_22710 [Burkholderia dolosa PC543]|nr:hypothetical protein BDSB_22710 [Burkholderia dolosa PC543]
MGRARAFRPNDVARGTHSLRAFFHTPFVLRSAPEI